MEENKTGNPYFTKTIETIKSTVSSSKQTLVLGMSSSLIGGTTYSFIVSFYHYFTPTISIVAGLAGGFGIAIRDILSEKEKGDDIQLKELATYILFGIIALFLGYTFVYYFVKIPAVHGEFIRPVEIGSIYNFFKNTMGLPDIFGAILGSISSLSIPIIFKKKIRVLIYNLKLN